MIIPFKVRLESQKPLPRAPQFIHNEFGWLTHFAGEYSTTSTFFQIQASEHVSSREFHHLYGEFVVDEQCG